VEICRGVDGRPREMHGGAADGLTCRQADGRTDRQPNVPIDFLMQSGWQSFLWDRHQQNDAFACHGTLLAVDLRSGWQ
jgi:hypothetical protein